MNQPISRVRLFLLAALLVVELALAMSLRTSGWIATGHAIRSLIIVIAATLPFVMTAILLYRVRVRLRYGQISLRTLMALTLVVASYLALLPLFARPTERNLGPSPISKSVKFEVFKEATIGTPNGMSFTNPDSGTALTVVGPPIITGSDVLTIQLATKELNQGHTYLDVTLLPASGNKLLKATTVAIGSTLVVVVDGEVISAPRISAPVGNRFRLTGGRIDADRNQLFNALTAK